MMQLALLAVTAISALVILALSALMMRDLKLAWLVMAAFILTVGDIQPAPFATVGGISIFPSDAFAAVLVAAMLITPRSGPRARGSLLWLALGTAAAYSLIRGSFEFGFPAAINEMRTVVALLAVCVWISRERYRPGFLERTLPRFIVWTGWALVALAVYHIATRGLGSADTVVLVGDESFSGRPLVSSQALFLVLAATYALVHERWPTALIFAAIAILSQNRSVWVAGAAVGLIWVLRAGPVIRRALLPLAFFVGGGVLCLILSGTAQGLVGQFVESATSSGTLDGRIYDWTYLYDAQNRLGWHAIITGQPMGTGFGRPSPQGFLTYPPHNWYVVLYLRVGLIGTVAWVLVLAGVFLRHSRARRDLQAASALALGTFCIFYHLPFTLAPLVALAFMSPIYEPFERTKGTQAARHRGRRHDPQG